MANLWIAFVLTLVSGTYCATFSSSDKFAEFKDGGYIVRNDVWGSGAGTQELHATNYHDWGVHANHPNTGGVKSYAHVAKNVNKKLSALKSVTSSFGVSVPSSGAYTTAYDIWCDNNKYEIMLWMNQHGAVGPIGATAASATVSGHTWDVHKGTNGHNEVFSFILKGSSTNSGTVDVLAILEWIKKEGWFGDVTLGEVQFGFEITSAAGGLDFSVTKFSVESS
jgi:hypothetical protein